MATIIIPPTAYSSVKNSVIFTVLREDNSLMEVMINGYIKQLPKGAGDVNVAHYYREYFDAQPVKVVDDTFKLFSGVECDRTVEAYITADGIVSERATLIFANRRPRENQFMSDLHHRIICRGQVDEVSVFLTGPAVLVCGEVRTPISEGGLWVVSFKVPEQCPNRFVVSLESVDGMELDRIGYVIEPSDGVRLGWINAYGAIDFWNFPVCLKTSLKISRGTIYTSEGYRTTSMLADTTRSLTSQALPSATIEALSQLFTSDAAWTIEGAESIPIDITSDVATLSDSERPNTVVVEYRNKNR